MLVIDPKKKKIWTCWVGWQNHGSGKREKKTKKRVGVGMLGELDVVKRGRKVKFMG